MQISDMKTGTRLEVSWFKNGAQNRSETDSPVYVSQLLEPPSGRQLLIAIPIQEFRLVSWPDDCCIEVSFTQQGSCVWSFTARYVEQLEIDKIQAYRIEADETLIRRQRREWYRLPCSLDMTFRLVPPGDDEDCETNCSPEYQAITRDISGGGAAFVTSAMIQENQEIEVSLQLENNRPVLARGRIIRVSEIDNLPGRRQLSLQFTEISQPNQNTLVQYVFKQQLNQNRRK